MPLQDWDLSDVYAPEVKADIPYDRDLVSSWHLAAIAGSVLLLTAAVSAFAPEGKTAEKVSSTPTTTFTNVAPE